MRRKFLTAPRNDERSSIGDFHVEAAISALNRTCQIHVGLMTEYLSTREHTLRMLFSDDLLDKATAVRGIIEPGSKVENYTVMPGVDLFINFEGARVPTIMKSAFKPLLSGAIPRTPLLAYITTVQGIYRQYEEVKQVLRWLNRNATPGAIRFYWPTALQLCPNATSFQGLDHVPSRFTMPPGISNRMQMLKDAATCVVSSLLLPSDREPNLKKNMWVRFDKETIRPNDDVDYLTDVMTFNMG